MVERRTSVNRSPCGRRTSLPGKRKHDAALPTVYSDRAGDSMPFAPGLNGNFNGNFRYSSGSDLRTPKSCAGHASGARSNLSLSSRR